MPSSNIRCWSLDAEYETVPPPIQLAASDTFYARTRSENVSAEKGVLGKRSELHRFDVLGGANHFMTLAPTERTPGSFTPTCDYLPSRLSIYPRSPLFHCEPIINRFSESKMCRECALMLLMIFVFEIHVCSRESE